MSKFPFRAGMSEAMLAAAGTRVPDTEVDWVWIATTCLWERWQSNMPNMEMVDDKLQAGYKALRADDTLQACRLWLDAWRAILRIIDRSEMDSLDEFDDRFGGTQCVFNWVQDFEMQLHNAGLEDLTFYRERISLCETMLDRFAEGKLPIDNFKTALAASHFELGDREKGDRLFRDWLQEDPEWGSGWVSWSDCHWLFARSEQKDAARAKQILQEGLAVPDVENRTRILERLQLLYEETGREKDAEQIRAELERVGEPTTKKTVTYEPDSLPVRQTLEFVDEEFSFDEPPDLAQSLQAGRSAGDVSSDGQPRVGRNAPCPCGSGKKFKKCCARKPR